MNGKLTTFAKKLKCHPTLPFDGKSEGSKGQIEQTNLAPITFSNINVSFLPKTV